MKFQIKKSLVLITAIALVPWTLQAQVIKRDHGDFFTWTQCNDKTNVMFAYSLGKDDGHVKRTDDFRVDTALPFHCQQKSSEPYRTAKANGQYHRGHLKSANSGDATPESMSSTFVMSNIVPQHSVSNTQAWNQTEVIEECYRDISPLSVVGGAIYTDKSNDYFLKSHGVKTPESMWKVITQNNLVIAWNIPNDATATKSMLSEYIVTVDELEKLTGITIPVPEKLKYTKPYTNWPIPKNCDRG
ncbi:DNA/RNA non-specific endonuclease [Aliivibrio fischeri]|uniref:DNA/RNA non-specific endonuclease n=1 Tax=Aliivibrio fischeri TaxID=668 RepID=UPI0012D9162E|nr:DNA/RNA non-specific endonuclease [Aliivibrio fischeri]MUJ20485.1 DNA/RNA non-specific endonuclease [Aliivibrio fischeri]